MTKILPFGFSNTVGFHCFDVDGDIWEFYGGMPDTKELIVIGNIHEHPELLKTNKIEE